MRKRRSSTKKNIEPTREPDQVASPQTRCRLIGCYQHLRKHPLPAKQYSQCFDYFNYHYIFRVDYTNVCHLRLQLCI